MLSSKIIRYRLLGAYYREDMCERFGATFPALARTLYWRVPARVAAQKLIFIHVPRVAGTSITRAVFGGDHVGHGSIRSYRTLAPELYAVADSFALVRQPIERFWSAFHFVRHRGASEAGMSRAFRHLTRHVETVDDYLDFIDGKPPLALDHVMRPQTWFVTDLETGQPLVKNPFLLGRDEARLARFLRPYGASDLVKTNASQGIAGTLTAAQEARVRRLYAGDFALIEGLKSNGPRIREPQP